MPGDMMLGIGLVLMVAFWILFFITVIVQKLVYKYGKAKTVKAVVVSTYKTEVVSHKGMGTTVKCGVVFRTEKGRKLSFRISALSHGGYRKGEWGTLKYKGARLISFE